MTRIYKRQDGNVTISHKRGRHTYSRTLAASQYKQWQKRQAKSKILAFEISLLIVAFLVIFMFSLFLDNGLAFFITMGIITIATWWGTRKLVKWSYKKEVERSAKR
jgi:hypothetical protein